jgi:hypothetical protein
MALAVTLVVVGPAASAADDVAGLTGLDRVRLRVDLAHPLEGVTAGDLTTRLAGGLLRAEPPLTVQESATDLVRLTALVRPVSATTLRGFWLPFSGTYAVGTLRLAVERPVTLPGSPRTLSAVVWLIERTVSVAWRGADAEITRLLDEMAAALLQARRRSSGAAGSGREWRRGEDGYRAAEVQTGPLG